MCFALISLSFGKDVFTLSTLNAVTTLPLHYLGRMRLRINKKNAVARRNKLCKCLFYSKYVNFFFCFVLIFE